MSESITDSDGTIVERRAVIDSAPEVSSTKPSPPKCKPGSVASGYIDEDSTSVSQSESATPPKKSVDDTIVRMAALPPVEYDRARYAEAKRLGIRVATLDAEVIKRRPKSAMESPPKSDAEKPWDSPVDGAALLDEISGSYRRFIVLPPYAADAIAVYTLNTYVAAECFHYCAIVLVVAPEHECGKGRVLDVAQALCRNTFRTANTSAAVLYRLVGSCEGHTTLLVDEIDSQAQEQRENISNVLKSGFEKAGKSHRLEKDGDKMKLVEFSTYCPKICAGISIESFDRATISRSITIRMKKKTRAEKVDKFRRFDGTEIRRKCLRWATDNVELLRSMPQVQFPPELCSDRQEDIWEPLIWVAQACGKEWEDRAWKSCAGLTGNNAPATETTKHLLFRLCCEYVEKRRNCEHVPSQELVDYLNGLEDADFKDWRKGKGISQSKLAAFLNDYEIHPGPFKCDGKSLRGYNRASFQDASARYLRQYTSDQGATVQLNQCFQGNGELCQGATNESGCTLETAMEPKPALTGCTVAPSGHELTPEDAELANADLV